MKKLIISAALTAFMTSNVIAAPAKDDHQNAHWGYSGKNSPHHWGNMQKEFATCKLGKAQSPVDIRGAKKAELPEIRFDYVSSPAEVINNGHTIQVNLASGGTIKLASGDYKLLQFHFHAPSEEKINGKTYPMNAHFVHQNEEGKLAVVTVLFKQGKKNPELAKIFAVMPKEAEGKAALPDGMNATDLLPGKREYYSFIGSLTTPPCSEDVRWQVLKQPVELSKSQLAAFKKLYPMNARPVQPLNGRIVEQN